jgi:hypothetical protein
MTVRSAAPRLLLFLPWLLAGLAGSFMAGILVEVHNVWGPDWLFLWVDPLVTAVWVAMAVALALALGGARRLWASVLLGAFLSSLAFVVFILGDFFPWAAGLGNRRLDSYGGDIDSWDDWLAFSLAFSGMVGAVFGAFSGFLSWAFRRLSRAHMEKKWRA